MRFQNFVWLLGLLLGSLGAGSISANEAAPSSQSAEEAKPPEVPTANFAARSPFHRPVLSPDGSQIAMRGTLKGETSVYLFDAETRKPIRKFGLAEDTNLEWVRWAGDDKLLISISQMGQFYGQDALYSRLVLASLSEGWMETLGRRNSVVTGDDVIFVSDDGAYALVSVQREANQYPSVMRYELTQDGEMTTVQNPRDGVWNWYADDAGVVRAGTGWYRNRLRVFYRSGPSDDLKLVGKLKAGDEKSKYWDVAQILSGSDRGYVLQENDEGRVGLHLFDYASREIVETVYENPDWDIDSATIRDGKPLAAYYTDDRDKVVWFDEESEKHHNMLMKALPEEEVWVVSRSKDNSRIIVWAGGEADPGAFYIYTPGAKRLDPFVELRPGLPIASLAKPKPVSYVARDGTRIRGYLTLPRGREAKDLPLILLPHGGPYGIRDSLRFSDEVQLLANRGYAVLQPNFRGSGGYGDAFFELGTGQIGRGMQDDLDDAMDWAVAEGIADKERVCVVGASYGGYAALWSVIRNPERYRCAASWAGVTDWDMMLKYDRRYFTRKAGKKWSARVQGDEEFDLDTVSPYRLAETLSRPVLLAHGTDDNNVPFKQFKKFTKAAKKAKVRPVELVIEDEGHSFSKKESEQAWYDALVTFLAKHNPPD